MDLQRIQVKLYLEPDAEAPPDSVIPVFHQWIRDAALDELLIDVADYSHVPSGPGILLVAHAADYNLDESEGRKGLLYTRKRDFDGDIEAALVDALSRVLTAARKLQAEPSLPWAQTFGTSELRIRILDRLRAPNDGDTFNRLLPNITEAVRYVYGERPFTIRREEDERRPLTVRVHVDGAPDVSGLIAA